MVGQALAAETDTVLRPALRMRGTRGVQGLH